MSSGKQPPALEEAFAQAREEALEATDVERLAREALAEQLASSALLRMNAAGQARFAEEQLERRLEEIFLQQVLDDIHEDTGPGFMARLGESYDGLMTHFEEIEDLAQLAQVDWPQSVLRARLHGYAIPPYPYFMAPRFEGPRPTALDSAITVDTSASMADNDRMQVATKTALATRALMRKLNPESRVSLSHFSDSLEDTSSAAFARRVTPRGGTSTHLALGWLLDKLAWRGPSIAYLITDGEPDWPDRALEAAERFTDHPEITLRVFLVDGDPLAKRIVQKLGAVAGERSQVIHVSARELPGALIRDVAVIIDEIVDLGSVA